MIAIGGTNIVKAYLGQTELANIAIGDELLLNEPAPLPYDAEIEFLESTGTQYIDLGAKATLSTTIEVEFYATDSSAIRVFGARSAWNRNAFSLMFASASDARASFNYDNIGNVSVLTFNIYLNDGNWHIAKSNGGGHIQVDNTSKNLSASSFTTPYNVILFGNNNNGTNGYGKVRIRRVKFNSLDLIPVRIGQVGYLYDKVGGTFFGNAGTGDFVLGNDVT